MEDSSRSIDEAGRLAAVKRYEILDTPPDGAFDGVAELAARIFEVPIAIISIVDHDRIWFKSHHGLSISQIEREPGLCASAILRDIPTFISDARIDPKALTNSLVAGAFGLRFYAAAPLHTSDGYNLGTLCVIDREPRLVTAAQGETLKSMAAIVVDQLELRLKARRIVEDEAQTRERMEKIIAERTAQLTRLTQELIRLSEEERAKLARELHDDMGSTLTLLTMKLNDLATHLHSVDSSILAEHQQAADLVLQLIGSQRRIVESLRPMMLETFGLVAAIQHHAEDWSSKSGINMNVAIPAIFPVIESDAALALFRVVQESLTNVAKYASASSVTVTLAVENHDITVCVEDDGIGIAPEKLQHPSSHGIVGMRERLSPFGGRLVIESGQNQRGSRVKGTILTNRAISKPRL